MYTPTIALISLLILCATISTGLCVLYLYLLGILFKKCYSFEDRIRSELRRSELRGGARIREVQRVQPHEEGHRLIGPCIHDGKTDFYSVSEAPPTYEEVMQVGGGAGDQVNVNIDEEENVEMAGNLTSVLIESGLPAQETTV